MVDEFFKDVNVAKALRGILRRRGVADHDLEDCVQDVYEAVVVWSRKVGLESAEELGKAAGVIAKRIGTSYWRAVAADGRRNVGLIGDPDAKGGLENPSALELVDVKKVLAEINRMLAEGNLSEKGAAVFRALAMGDTLAEHAEETGQSDAAVRKTAQRSKEQVVTRLEERGLADVGLRRLLTARVVSIAAAVAVVLLLVYGAFLRGFGHEPVAHHDPLPQGVPDGDAGVALPRPDQKVLALTREDREKAAGLLLQAEIAYKRGEWRKCIQRVRDARALDPSVDSAAQLENECFHQEEREGNAKAPPGRR